MSNATLSFAFPEEPSNKHEEVLSRIRLFLAIRIALLFSVVAGTVILGDGYSIKTSFQIYTLTFFSFLFTFFFSLWLDQIGAISYFIMSQVVYDVLYAGALMHYTGGMDSSYTYLFPLTVIYTSFCFHRYRSIAR